MENQKNFLQASGSASVSTNLNEEMKIKEILQEQEKLKTLYNQVVVYIQEHPQMPTEEMIKYQTQLKQLSDYYQTNQEKLKTLGYSTIQVNKNVTLKKGARRNISLKTIFLGCGSFVFVFLLGLVFLFFYLVKNPGKLAGLDSLGITPSVAKSLLQGLSLTVMLVVLLLGIVILFVNVYKAFTQKNKSKIWYYGGIILGTIILGLGLAVGTKILGEVSNINVEELTDPGSVVTLYMQGVKKDKQTLIKIDDSFPLIAPMNVNINLLRNNFANFVGKELQSSTVTNLALDCGNGQTVKFLDKTTQTFERPCFYTKKGIYNVKLLIDYYTANNEKKSVSYPIKELDVRSQISLNGIGKQISGEVNELVVGPLPVDIEFEADQVFRDFNLNSYKVKWDGDFDGIVDKENDASFRFSYDSAKVYYPTINFPTLSQEISYTFPLRIEQSGVPVCDIAFQQQKVNDYQITASFFDGTERFISDYSFIFYDKATGKVIDQIHDTDLGFQFNYRFPGRGSYIVKINFITTDDKKGSCESEVQLMEKSTFNVMYDLFTSSVNDITYKKLNADTIAQNKIISIAEIPTKLKLKFIKIEPKTYDMRLNVYLDDKPVIFSTEGEYIFDIRSTKPHTIKIQISDKIRGLEYEEVLTTQIGLEDIIGKLSVVGENIGFEPFEVTLDASASKINDPNDQIVYFSWDFGDGKKQEKVSNGVIKHMYRFDYENNNGTFTPKVTIHTQKGRSITIDSNMLIVVKKQVIELNISSPSHPTQEARIGDPVDFLLDFNGLPEQTSWDFGDGQVPITCEGRFCSEMTKTWDKKGRYLIKVKMDFEDQQSVEKTMEFFVRD